MHRGVRDVLHVAHDYVAQGPLSNLFWGHIMPESAEPTVTLPAAVHSEFDRLQEMLQQQCAAEPENLAHCSAALRDLLDIYRNLRYFAQRYDLETSQIWRWTSMVSTEYVRLIQAQHPAALVVLGYFAAATTAVQGAWYCEGLGLYTLEGISVVLDQGMQHWLDWPREQVRCELAVITGGR